MIKFCEPITFLYVDNGKTKDKVQKPVEPSVAEKYSRCQYLVFFTVYEKLDGIRI